MDLSEATGRDREEIEIGGQVYHIGPVTAGGWGGVQNWISRSVKSPLARAVEQLNELDVQGIRVKPTDRQAILDGARKEGRIWPPPIRSDLWMECLRHKGGDEAFFYAALKPHNPDLTPEEVPAIVAAATGKQVARLMLTALGARADADPKASGNSTD
jgi:hypothetical protein